MPQLKLRKLLERYLAGARKIALLAVGSELRGDDAAALLVAEKLQSLAKNPKFRSRFRLFIGETAPENLTGVIRKFNPDHLIVVDAADAGREPGEIMSISPQDAGGISFSTHQLPLKLMIQYLQESLSCAVTVVGIQPKGLEFNSPMSKEVRASALFAAGELKRAVQSVLYPRQSSKKRGIKGKRS